MRTPGTVIIIDDDLSVRKGLSNLLKTYGFDVLCFESGDAFLKNIHQFTSPSCMLLDVRMPNMTGIELQEELAQKSSHIPIVFITGFGDIPMSVRAMKRGAVDFLTKPFDEVDLVDAVKHAMEKSIQHMIVQSELEQILSRLSSLTAREMEILRFLITGALNKQIAFALGISEKTVKVHRARVLEKMGAKSIADLVRMAEKANIEPALVSA